jgi:hypothetical protein
MLVTISFAIGIEYSKSSFPSFSVAMNTLGFGFPLSK